MSHRDMTADEREEVRKKLDLSRVGEIIAEIDELERDDSPIA